MNDDDDDNNNNNNLTDVHRPNNHSVHSEIFPPLVFLLYVT